MMTRVIAAMGVSAAGSLGFYLWFTLRDRDKRHSWPYAVWMGTVAALVALTAACRALTAS